MTTTVDRRQAIKIHKVLDKVWDMGWFQKGMVLLNLSSTGLKDMHLNADLWIPPSWVDFFVWNPEGETSRYKWDLRRVDQLRNLYVYRK